LHRLTSAMLRTSMRSSSASSGNGPDRMAHADGGLVGRFSLAIWHPVHGSTKPSQSGKQTRFVLQACDGGWRFVPWARSSRRLIQSLADQALLIPAPPHGAGSALTRRRPRLGGLRFIRVDRRSTATNPSAVFLRQISSVDKGLRLSVISELRELLFHSKRSLL
jgi:hypothetical protein